MIALYRVVRKIMDAILEELIAWGEQQPDVRAMVLTSTRATGVSVDQFSDYDVVLLCTDIQIRHNDKTWLQDFGDVVIAYWDDIHPEENSGLSVSGNVVYYPGTRKIDFSLWPVEIAVWLADQSTLPAELDAGFQILLDKDQLTDAWPIPTRKGYELSLPTHAEYLTLVNDFLVGIPYVETALIRGELLPAKWVLDYDMRYVYLVPLLGWYAISIKGNSARIGNLGKGLSKLLPADIWSRFADTYAGVDVEVNRACLYQMVALFREVAEYVGKVIGCDYPAELHNRVIAHAKALAG